MTVNTDDKIIDARHFISNVLVEEMHQLDDGTVTPEQFNYLIDALKRQSFVDNHHEFFESVRKIATGNRND